jgi:hypothetical protein
MSAQTAVHGTDLRYKQGCRCTPCTKEAVRADAQRKVDRLAGRPRILPSDEVCRHIQALLGVGLKPAQVAEASGMPRSSIARLVRGVQPTIHRATAEKILAVPVTVRPFTGDVPALGAIRRLRALYALGHFNQDIAAAVGMNRESVCALVAGNWTKISVQNDEAVRQVYGKLSMTVGASWKTRRLAESKGWAPPLAWDDDTIDDPAASPVLDAPEPAAAESGGSAVARFLMGESVVLDHAGRREAIGHLMEWTDLTPAEIAVRMESSAGAVSRTWERIKKQARDEGRPAPWRRKLEIVSRSQMSQRHLERAA